MKKIIKKFVSMVLIASLGVMTWQGLVYAEIGNGFDQILQDPHNIGDPNASVDPPQNNTPQNVPQPWDPNFVWPLQPTNAEKTSSILCIPDAKLRSGDVGMDDIPKALACVIQVVIGLAGTVAILMLIYFAVKMQLASGITGDASGADKAKKWMIAALVGFIIAISAWFIMARVIDLLSQASGG